MHTIVLTLFFIAWLLMLVAYFMSLANLSLARQDAELRTDQIISLMNMIGRTGTSYQKEAVVAILDTEKKNLERDEQLTKLGA